MPTWQTTVPAHAKRQETFTSHLRHYHRHKHSYRIGDAAALLGVSADTVRRLVDGGKLTAAHDELGRRITPGAARACAGQSTDVVVEKP